MSKHVIRSGFDRCFQTGAARLRQPTSDLGCCAIRNSGTISGGVIRYGRPPHLAIRAPDGIYVRVTNASVGTDSAGTIMCRHRPIG
jgi:hypothetical protein